MFKRESPARPCRLGLIAGQLGIGGAEQQLYYLVSRLDPCRFEPIVISLGPAPGEYWEERLRDLGIPVSHVARERGRLERIRRVAAALSAHKAHVVHSWAFHTNVYAALSGRLADVTVRVGSMRESPQGLPRVPLLRWAGYRGLDALVINSAESAAQVNRQHLTGARVYEVPNGVPVPDRVSGCQRGRVKRELGFAERDVLIGSVGRLDANKNHAMLMRAFAALAPKWPQLRLAIIGDGPLRSDLVETSHRLRIQSRVCLPGLLPEASRYLSAFEVCCVTSYTEGMPNLIMEAAAAGTPVVSTRCGGSLSLIEDGHSGYLVMADDADSMARRIDLLLENPVQRLRMGNEARAKMRREFSITAMVERMTRVYEETLCQRMH